MTFYGYIMSHKLCTLCNIVESQNRTNITKQVVMAIMVSENTAVEKFSIHQDKNATNTEQIIQMKRPVNQCPTLTWPEIVYAPEKNRWMDAVLLSNIWGCS